MHWTKVNGELFDLLGISGRYWCVGVELTVGLGTMSSSMSANSVTVCIYEKCV